MFLLGPVGQLGIFGISSILFIGHTSSRCSDVDVAIYFLSRDKVRLEVCVSPWAVGHIRHIKHSAQRPHELSNPPSGYSSHLKFLFSYSLHFHASQHSFSIICDRFTAAVLNIKRSRLLLTIKIGKNMSVNIL